MIYLPVPMTPEVSGTSGQAVRRMVGEQARDSAAAAAE